jgi:ABC-type sugar transport system substrate-binding protein
MSRRFCLSILSGLLMIGCGEKKNPEGNPSAKDAPRAAGKRLRMGMMPKLVGIEYFKACEKGARQAAAELDVELTYDGPSVDSVEEQAQMIDVWIARDYDVIAVAPNDPEVISPALQRAKAAGIIVMTWDADANPEASGRDAFVNQAPTEEIGNTLVDVLAKQIHAQGKTVIVTGSANSPNQNAWMKVMKARLEQKFPKIKLLETLAPEEDQNRARQMTAGVLNAHPDLAGVWGITSVALPGAAEAVRQANKAGKVAVTGLSLPKSIRPYVKDGVIQEFVLWNPVDLGYLTVHVAKALADKALKPGVNKLGRLDGVRVEGREVILGPPIVFDKNNIDMYDF